MNTAAFATAASIAVRAAAWASRAFFCACAGIGGVFLLALWFAAQGAPPDFDQELWDGLVRLGGHIAVWGTMIGLGAGGMVYLPGSLGRRF